MSIRFYVCSFGNAGRYSARAWPVRGLQSSAKCNSEQDSSVENRVTILNRVKSLIHSSKLQKLLNLESRQLKLKQKKLGRSKEELELIRIRTEQRKIGMQEKQKQQKLYEDYVNSLQIESFAAKPILDVQQRSVCIAEALKSLSFVESDWESTSLTNIQQRFEAMKVCFHVCGIRIPEIELQRFKTLDDIYNYYAHGSHNQYKTLKQRRQVEYPKELKQLSNVVFMGRLRSLESKVGGQFRLNLAELKE